MVNEGIDAVTSKVMKRPSEPLRSRTTGLCEPGLTVRAATQRDSEFISYANAAPVLAERRRSRGVGLFSRSSKNRRGPSMTAMPEDLKRIGAGACGGQAVHPQGLCER
jgi:hypothetical protein